MPQSIPIDDFTILAELPEADTGLPPILLVHGLFAGPWCFDILLAGFAARGFPTYAVPLSGRAGGRPADIGKLSIADFADDARDALVWIARRHGQPPALLGHSMGGLIAQLVASRNDVAALILLAPAPPRGIPLVNPRLFVKQFRRLPKILLGKALSASVEEMDDITLNCVPVEQRAALHPKFVPDSGRAARDITFGAVAVDEDQVRCPVLCVTGADDRLIPPAVTRRIAARYHAPTWTYEGHGHFLVMEPGAETMVDDLSLWLRHVALMREHPARLEDLWLSLQGSIGEVVDLTFFDGGVVRAEMVNVDLAVRRTVVYRLLEVKRRGTTPAATPEAGDIARAALHELSAVTPAVA